MSKKKSKKLSGNIWDLTPEEQQAQLAEFEEMEKGEVNVLSLIGDKHQGLDENGLSAGLEALIVKDQRSKDEVRVGFDDEMDDEVNPEDFAFNKMKRDDNKDFEMRCPLDDDVDDDDFWAPPIAVRSSSSLKIESRPLYDMDLRLLLFAPIHELNRLIIDDGIAPTSISFDVATTEDIVGSVDAQQAAEACSQLFNYILSLKHPTAIYEEKDFHNTDFWKFGCVKLNSYNKNRYFFMEDNGYVFCYYIDDTMVNELNKLISEKYSSSVNEILSIYMSMAYAVGTMHQAFFIEEEDYIEKLMNSEEFNQQKEFHDKFVNDLSTELLERGVKPSEQDGIYLMPAKELQIESRRLLEYLSGDDYYEDEEDDTDIPGIPMSVTETHYVGYRKHYVCPNPNCFNNIFEERDINYCPGCGIPLDWTEMDKLEAEWVENGGDPNHPMNSKPEQVDEETNEEDNEFSDLVDGMDDLVELDGEEYEEVVEETEQVTVTKTTTITKPDNSNENEDLIFSVVKKR